MKSVYRTNGVCASAIELDIEDGIINSVKFKGGCPGNVVGISQLVEGMSVDEAVRRLAGVRCGHKDTSCPDQLAKALAAHKTVNA